MAHRARRLGPDVAVGLAVMPRRFTEQAPHWVLPALVIDPCTREVPEENSLGTRPT